VLQKLACLLILVLLAEPAESGENERQLLTLSGHLELNFESEANYDLDDNEEQDVATLEPKVQIDLTYRPTNNFFTLLSLKIRREYRLWEEGDSKDRNLQVEIEEAYLDASDIFYPGLGIRFGRQTIEDERQWLLDAEFDGPRIYLQLEDLRIEASVVREDYVNRDLLNADDKGDTVYYFLNGRYELPKKRYVTPYFLALNDLSDDDEDLYFVGVQSGSRTLVGLRHWFDLAYVGGNDGNNDVSGFGLDIGGSYIFDAPFRPRLILGYAYGSGDADTDDGRDSNFRQTGLQDNDGRIGGVVNVHFYGEAFRPELSNMEIYTAGVGFRPLPRTSVDILFHHYRQVEATDEVRDSDFDRDPLGNNKTLGSALDVVFGYREFRNFRFELAFGYFKPGSAYGSDADSAFFGGSELRYQF